MDVHWVEYYQNMKTNGVDQSDETKSEDNDDMTGGEKVENQGEEEKMKSQIATYKAVVTGSKDDAWNALKRMGVQSPQAVANFIAILAYVNYEKESYLSSYTSDPNGLAKYILPQLKKLILDEALDTGGTGQFVSVGSCLKVLGCDKIPIYRKGMYPADKPGFEAWKPQWKDWHTLGILPRNDNRSDLLIPMLRKRPVDGSEMKEVMKDKVSLILIRKPVVNPQSKQSNCDVIRMFMDMRNEVGMRSEQDYLNFKFIYCTSLKDKSALTAIAREGPSALN
ncbi:hypothetical protein JG688_00005411 [Phytophthora aleatoria]|uniref:Uncharacterized protein n=1 Tax=Phytophthora aleatoria TaxID=2496075 RepID=A0A8J5J9D6_9STRA|nr:hypothetical protein JG688_00005411 [Phytophthora aleatoria]